MPQSSTQIRDRAAQLLGILRIGQSLQAQDATRVTQGYAEVYGELKSDGYATWASTASVPDELATHVVSLVAANCADEYGVSDARMARIVRREAVARREIPKFATSEHESQDDPVDY